MDAKSELPSDMSNLSPQPEPDENSAAPKGDTYNLPGDFRGAHIYIKSNIQTQTEAHSEINREYMLKRVRKDWLEGVLEPAKAIHSLIALGMQHQARLVENPWDAVDQRRKNFVPRSSTSDHILEVFDEANGALLILGEPGAGKTITLLQLANELIQRAETNATQQIPIVFNLSAWDEGQVPFEKWLMEELRSKYFVPRLVAEEYIAKNSLTLLLDGLDEVPDEQRSACIEAINLYRQDHGPAQIAVCCRRAVYEEQPQHLHLDDALLLQPLGQNQINQILAEHEQGQVVAATLEQDTTLRQLARTPLMLNIMLLAGGEISAEDWSNLGSTAAHRQRLFDVYLNSVFSRRGRSQAKLEESTLQVLPWLARNLNEQGQTVFLMEGLSPAWLKTRWQRLLSTAGMSLLIASLLALSTMLFYTAAESPARFVLKMPQAIGLAALVTAMASARLNKLLTLLLHMSLTWLTCSWALEGRLEGLAAAVIVGIPTGAAVIAAKNPRIIEKLHWSWKRVLVSLCMVILVELLAGLFIYWTAGIDVLSEIANSIQLLQFAALLVGPGILLAFGWRPSLRVASTVKPNQGFWQSLRNTAGIIIFFALILTPLSITTGVSDNLNNQQYMWDPDGLLPSMLFVLSTVGLVALPFGLKVGGAACLQQLVIRSILTRAEDIPWNLVSVLDHATDRILLQRVGGGYIFQHRLLQDYFANLQPQPTEKE